MCWWRKIAKIPWISPLLQRHEIPGIVPISCNRFFFSSLYWLLQSLPVQLSGLKHCAFPPIPSPSLPGMIILPWEVGSLLWNMNWNHKRMLISVTEILLGDSLNIITSKFQMATPFLVQYPCPSCSLSLNDTRMFNIMFSPPYEFEKICKVRTFKKEKYSLVAKVQHLINSSGRIYHLEFSRKPWETISHAFF